MADTPTPEQHATGSASKIPGKVRWPDLNRREISLLWLLGAAAFFNRYDEGLFSLLLVQIQADLGIADGQVGLLGSIVRLGALPAVAVGLMADRIGRRRILLFSIVGYTVMTAATALAPDARAFIAFQFFARMFITVEFGLGFIVIVEEFRAEHRGWGIAVLGTFAAFGFGLSMILFGNIEHIPYGWRGLYALGVGPLILLAYFRRRLPETRRFEKLKREDASFAAVSFVRGSWLRPVRALVRDYPGRFAAVAFVGFFWSASNGSVDFFLPKYCQEVLGWTPPQFARVAVIAGGVGLTGQLVAGWLSDRYGRKPNAIVFLLAEPVLAIALYSTVGWPMIPMYTTWVFASVAADVAGRTYGAELFPTSARATAGAALGIVGTLGGVLGLAAESLLFAQIGSHWLPVRMIAATGLVIPIVIFFVYPETSGKQLEEISPESPPDVR
jgi:MFS family permease